MKDDQIGYWLSSAQHDLEAAEALFEKEKYDWCLFLGHLVLEKVFKGYYVKVIGKHPPYTHSLPSLADKIGLRLTEKQLRFLEQVDDFHIEARYPDRKLGFYKICTKEFAMEYFEKIKGFYQWILKKI